MRSLLIDLLRAFQDFVGRCNGTRRAVPELEGPESLLRLDQAQAGYVDLDQDSGWAKGHVFTSSAHFSLTI